MAEGTDGNDCVIVNTPTGERKLQPLSASDWVSLGDTLRVYRKAKTRAYMRADKADEAVVKKALDEIDKWPVRYADVERFLNSLEGQHAALMASLRKDNADAGDAELKALGLHPSQWLRTVARLCDLQTVTEPEEGPGGPLAASPPETPTGGTSNATPTPSATTSSLALTPPAGPSPASTAPSPT